MARLVPRTGKEKKGECGVQWEARRPEWRKPSKGASGRQRTSVARNLCFLGPQLQPCISSENRSPSLYFLWTPAA